MITKMFNLITKDGTIIANDILTSTICDSEINDDISYYTLITNWRKRHKYI